MGIESFPGAEVKKDEFESLTAFRDEVGTLNARKTMAVGYSEDSQAFLIATVSESIKNKAGGIGEIDISLDAAQAKHLYETLERQQAEIAAMPATENEQFISREEKETLNGSRLTAARREFGTLKVVGNKLMLNVQAEDYRGLGPKALLLMQATGSRGPEGQAPIDIALSSEQIKQLHETLKLDMEKIETALSKPKA